MSVPKKQHFIPQFILRKFTSENFLFYYDKEKQQFSNKNTCDVFYDDFLYNDDINHSEDPYFIEKKLAKYESEIAPIFKRFDNGDYMVSYDEYEKIRHFLCIMSFRNIAAKQQFEGQLNQYSKWIYGKDQENGDFVDFWKRNLGCLINYRSNLDIINDKNINKSLKQHFIIDESFYMTIFERRGNINFAISDCYPVYVYGLVGVYSLTLYYYYPISPDRMIVLYPEQIKQVDPCVSVFGDKLKIRRPKINEENFLIPSLKIFQKDVETINYDITKNALRGYVIKFKDHE